MYIRKEYLNQIKLHKHNKHIKFITGVRGCGKTTLLKQFIDNLLLNGISSKQIIQLNYEYLDYKHLNNYQLLHLYVINKIVDNKQYYLFIDEIQMVEKFEKVLASLQLIENLDIYITGLNAYLLSTEIATMLSGRYVEIKILPFSFFEYYNFKKGDKEELFEEYKQTGGFPYALSIKNKIIYDDYIQGILNTVLIKDVMNRKGFSDALLLESIAKFIFSNIGNLVTIKKISDYLISSNRKTSSPTVEKYLVGLIDALLIYKVDRYNIDGKKFLQLNSKYYLTDLGLKNSYIKNQRPNYGSDLENIVFIELIRRGYKVYVGDTYNGEVDFVAIKDNIIEYYQVSKTVENKDTYEREISSFKTIKDNYRKILLTEDKHYYNDLGIEHKNIIAWLLNEED